MQRALALGAVIVALGGLPQVAHAQSVTPMTASVGSMGERYVLNLTVSNPYPVRKAFRITAFEPDGSPIAYWTDSFEFELEPADQRRITLAASFDGATSKEIYVCAETQVVGETGITRGQVCSHVWASRLAPSG